MSEVGVELGSCAWRCGALPVEPRRYLEFWHLLVVCWVKSLMIA
jgi:hypothetical protein